MESHYICPFRYRFLLFIKNFTKNALTLTTQKSPLGVSLSLSHTHIRLLWEFNLNFPTSISVTFIWESPGCFVFTVNGPYCCGVPAISGEGYECTSFKILLDNTRGYLTMCVVLFQASQSREICELWVKYLRIALYYMLVMGLKFLSILVVLLSFSVPTILGDPGADSGDEGKS